MDCRGTLKARVTLRTLRQHIDLYHRSVYEARILELIATTLGGGKAAVRTTLIGGVVVEGPAEVVGPDGRSAVVFVRQILLGMHRVHADGRVRNAHPGDHPVFLIDSTAASIDWSIGGTLRGPVTA